ncbi:MAG TPA: carboxypeptidase regulatory-like domain-containing protein [Pirellulales bacterium]|jgi:beta-lactamase regulating signal transducer with metallopeptidase domain/peroxiredoxin/protocatechuate 3,4-dioxygenase beta subunit|nr:carboxypeptidase regulatory-like domain-containing protein [Pirellulales bacterium]
MTVIYLPLASFERNSVLALVSMALWATLVLGIAWGAVVALRRASPAMRYCVWQFSLLSLLVVPLVCLLAPGIPLGFWSPATSPATENSAQPGLLASAPMTHAPLPSEDNVLRQFSLARPQTVMPPRFPSPSESEAEAKKSPSVAAVVATQSAPNTSGLRISWQVGAVLLWISGAVVHLLFLLYSIACARNVARRAVPIANAQFHAALNDSQLRLVGSRNVHLLKSTETKIPVVIGVFWPRILLPADVCRWSTSRLRMVLSHELAHVQRRDVLWQLIARTVAAGYWFHPLVWIAVRSMRREREQACDNQVLLMGITSVDYAAGLVEVAALLLGSKKTLTGGIGMIQPSQLEGRVRAILDKTSARNPVSVWARRMILLATACVVLTLGLLRPFSPVPSRAADQPIAESKPAAPAKPPVDTEKTSPEVKSETKSDTVADSTKKLLFDEEGNQPTKGSIRIHVVDFQGQPLSDAKITVSVATHDDKFKNKRDYITDADGQVNADLPSTLYILRLWANKSGYVSGFHGWEKDPPAKRKPVPEEFTFHLKTGTVMGGTVVDEEGKPIAGATVTINSDPGGLLAYDDLKTDAEGRWKLGTAPPGDKLVIHVIASHPDFISVRSYYDMNLDDRVPIEQLRNQTASIVLKRGVHVTGIVTDPDGKPVAKALAIWGDRPYWEHKPQQEVHTDDQGVYHLPPLPPGPMRVTIVAQGWMPDMRQIEIKPNLAPVDFQLKPGKTLRIRLVDHDGTPVTDALFHIENWHGAQSLYNDKHSNVIDSKIPRYPDKNGIYEWTWAPDDAVKFHVSAEGDFAAPEVDFTADDQEHVFTLPPLLRISGHVTDANTGQPIDKFTIVPVEELGENLLVTLRPKAKEQTGGQFVLDKLDRTDVAHRVRVEAHGYRSAISGLFHVGDKNTTADFQLQPAPAASGRVLDAEGQPVKGAKVFLATKTQQLDNPESDQHEMFSDNFCLETNAQGEFAFPAQCERYIVMVIHDAGYAELDLQPDQIPGDMKLEKWARIEGNLWQAGQPAAKAQIDFDPLHCNFFRMGDMPYIADHDGTQTDEHGHFVLERVPPIKCSVSAELSPWQNYPITSSQHVPLNLQPGQTVMLNLGGDGAQMKGQVKLAGEKADNFDLNWSLNYLLRKAPGIEPPAELSNTEFNWRYGWSEVWCDSQEGNVYRSTLNHYFVRLNSDGKLLISGVPAGEYELALRIYEHKEPTACMVNPVGSKIVSFQVTEADVAKGTLDLGTITVDATRGSQLGDRMPDFEFQTLDGAKKKLSDFRGQYVLIDFWATWCNSCVAELPQLQSLQDQPSASGKLAVLGVNLDSDQSAARAFIQRHPLPVMQGFLEEGPPAKDLTCWAASSIPSYILISPDGKLVQKSFSLSEIKDKLAALMAH